MVASLHNNRVYMQQQKIFTVQTASLAAGFGVRRSLESANAGGLTEEAHRARLLPGGCDLKLQVWGIPDSDRSKADGYVSFVVILAEA